MTSEDAFAKLLDVLRGIQQVANSVPPVVSPDQRRLLYVAHEGIGRVAAALNRDAVATNENGPATE